MARVKLQPEHQSPKDIDKALRKLKKTLENDGFFQELREREFYEAPSEERVRKKAAAVLRQKRKTQKSKLRRNRHY